MRDKEAIYLRKSKMDLELEKLGEGETLARHKATLLELAKQKDLNVVEIYEEVVSGESIADRPEMQRLLRDIYMKKYRSVIVMEVERLARGATKDQGEVAEAFKYSETFIVTPQKTYDPNSDEDEEYLEFGLFMSRREYKTIKRRLEAGKIRSIQEGNYVGSLPPYGYDIVRHSKKDRTLQFNDETKYVKMIFEWFVNDKLNASEIGRRLTAMNVPTRTGKSEWNRATIKDILKNNLYTGKLRWFRRKTTREFDGVLMKKTKHRNVHDDYLIVDGKHPAIIDEELFNKAQTQFKDVPPVEVSKMINPFAGVVFCSKCGKAMVFHRYTSKPHLVPRLTHRAGYICRMDSIAYDVFLDIVVSQIKKQIEDFTIEINGYNKKEKLEQYQELKEGLERTLKKEKGKITRLFDDYEDGFYERDEFKERKEIINSRIDGLKNQLENLKPPTTTEYEMKRTTFSNLLHTLYNDDVEVIKKNLLIKSIIKRIDYTNNSSITLDIYFKP